MIKAWSLDPQLKYSDSETGSLFDALEDMDVTDCLNKLVELYKLNA